MVIRRCIAASILVVMCLSAPIASAAHPEEDMARLMFSEAPGMTDTRELSRIAWSVVNCVDAEIAPSIEEAVRLYDFKEGAPLVGKFLAIANSVLRTWEREKSGEASGKRELPKQYVKFCTNHNHACYYTEMWG